MTTNKPEPVAYLRKDQLRQVQRMGSMFGEIADSPRTDRVPVYAATQPGIPKALTQEQQPDVTQLVEVLESLLDYVVTDFSECHGDKCRELWCLSCMPEDTATEVVFNARTVYQNAVSILKDYRSKKED